MSGNVKYCCNCRKNVNTCRQKVNIGIADIWNDYCEVCNYFIESGFNLAEIYEYKDKVVIDKESFDELVETVSGYMEKEKCLCCGQIGFHKMSCVKVK